MYVCSKCGTQVNEIPRGIIRCPSCAYKILFKAREPIAYTVEAE